MPAKMIGASPAHDASADSVPEVRPLLCRSCGCIRLEYMPLGWHCARCGAVSYRGRITFLGSCWTAEDCRRLAFYRWEAERGVLNEGVGPIDVPTVKRLIEGEPPAFTEWTRRELRALQFARWRYQHGRLRDEEVSA